MSSDDDYLQDLEILFDLDLLNKYERLNDAILITMANGKIIKIATKIIN